MKRREVKTTTRWESLACTPWECVDVVLVWVWSAVYLEYYFHLELCSRADTTCVYHLRVSVSITTTPIKTKMTIIYTIFQTARRGETAYFWQSRRSQRVVFWSSRCIQERTLLSQRWGWLVRNICFYQQRGLLQNSWGSRGTSWTGRRCIYKYLQ